MSAEIAGLDAGPRAAVLALLQEAEQSFERARLATALALAEQAVALARECNDLLLVGCGLMLLGKAQTYLGHPLQGYASASEAYDLLAACGDVERQLRVLSTCASALYMCGDPDRAIDLLRKGLAASAHRPDCSAVRAAMLINLGISLYQDAAEYAEAIQCSADAVALAAQASGTPGLRIRVATRLAYAHVYYADRLGDQGKHDEAVVQLEAGGRALPPLRSRLRLETSALRCRLATIERESDRRRYQANEALVHTQRLAVIGKLIAQTHHALSAPAERSCCLTKMALGLSNQGASPAALAKAGLDAIPTLIHACIEAGAAATVVLHIQTQARATAEPAADAPATLGITLCKEIAGEMDGSLQVMRDDTATLHDRLHYRLQLPGAGARMHELPGSAELR